MLDSLLNGAWLHSRLAGQPLAGCHTVVRCACLRRHAPTHALVPHDPSNTKAPYSPLIQTPQGGMYFAVVPLQRIATLILTSYYLSSVRQRMSSQTMHDSCRQLPAGATVSSSIRLQNSILMQLAAHAHSFNGTNNIVHVCPRASDASPAGGNPWVH